MEPTKAQKNSALINEMKRVREAINAIYSKLDANSREVALIRTHLEVADYYAIQRMVALGMSLKLEDSNER
ncbi:MAG TPA: hypothetical protein VFL85_03190 [Candidatus Saccharimonadales bacterium]|nr:hypothetical protein [Candidatus Saccharimonadales bacterium]